MDVEQKRRLFLSYIHFCQDVGFGVVRDTTIFQRTPLFCNDWSRNIKRGAEISQPVYFEWQNLPAPWLEFRDFLDESFPQGIIHEIKVQDGVPISWDHSRLSRSAPNAFKGVCKVYVLKDIASLPKYSASMVADSNNERPPNALLPFEEEK